MKVKKYDLRINKENRPVIAESGTEFKVDGRKVFNNPDLLVDFFGDSIGIRQAANEHVYIACLDTRLHIIGCFEASHGSVNETMFPVREILQKALLIGAVNIAISHNHPAGDPTPSQADIQSTNRISKAADLIGMHVIDHIIVAANTKTYYSFRENEKI